MKTLSPGLRSHLDSGATTLCHCWKLTTRENENFGFTDHDRDLVIDGVTYEAMAGFTASEIESSLGLAVDNLDASGALSSDALSEARLRAGDFDHAEIEIWRVNWQDVSQRVLMRKGPLGEVTHGGVGFTARLIRATIASAEHEQCLKSGRVGRIERDTWRIPGRLRRTQ